MVRCRSTLRHSAAPQRSRIASVPQTAVSQNPMPTSPPFCATLRSWSSLRLRLLSQVPRTPVCETTTGRVAVSRTSSICLAEPCERSTIIFFASMRRSISRPASVSPPFSDPVRGSRHFVVEEMRERHHAIAGVEQRIDIGRVAFQCMGAFNGEHAGDDAWLQLSSLQENLQVALRLDQHQPSAGADGHVVKAGGLIERTLLQAHQGPGRPALTKTEQGYVVGAAVVPLDVQSARRLCHHGEDLEGDVAFDQPRNIDMAPRSALDKVAPPQQRVGVQIRHLDRPVQGGDFLRYGVGRRLENSVQRRFDPGGEHKEENSKPGDGEQHHHRKHDFDDPPHMSRFTAQRHPGESNSPKEIMAEGAWSG